MRALFIVALSGLLVACGSAGPTRPSAYPITLRWTTPVGTVTGYKLTYGLHGQSKFQMRQFAANVNSATLQFPAGVYDFQVYALNRAEVGDPSNEITKQVP
jgi:hypothetical protein